MAAPSQDVSVHGVPSTDDHDGLRPRRAHRRRLHVSDRAVTPSESTPQASGDRLGFASSTLLAFISLLFVSAVAFGSMLASSAVLRLAYPDRRFDDLHALHEPLVLGVLCGLAVFWLLPPHPWAAQPAQARAAVA